MSGIQLAQKARESRPSLKVLLTSGYTGETPEAAAEFELIDKPYERTELARRLRRLCEVKEAVVSTKPKGRRPRVSAGQA
jgi:DNA-binding LytR/AlgR family response regulator